jgi:hypothetical protein
MTEHTTGTRDEWLAQTGRLRGGFRKGAFATTMSWIGATGE